MTLSRTSQNNQLSRREHDETKSAKRVVIQALQNEPGSATAEKQDEQTAVLENVLQAVDSVESQLETLISQTDSVESKLQTIMDNTDTIESILTDIEGGIPEALGQTAMANSMPVVVASDQTQIPTITEPQRESKLGHNYSIVSLNINAQAAETKLLSIENPSNSGVDLHFYAICNFVDPSNNNWCVFKYYLGSSGISAGTTVTPTNVRSGGSSDSSTVAKSLPTVTTLGSTIAPRAAPAGNTMGSLYAGELIQSYWILPPGANLVITGTAKANNVPTNIALEYIRKTFGT